ncbi:hypothetical protein AGR1A_Lc80251 [Agrobacterium fabacearum CFBP 5771]|nr:hypothetical protein AGR1A_Lc80251 [Agrobacterium fabacearum CFBP 5771]
MVFADVTTVCVRPSPSEIFGSSTPNYSIVVVRDLFAHVPYPLSEALRSARETASSEAETGTDVSGGFKKRVVVRLHACLLVQAVDIGVGEIEVQLLTGAALAKPAHRGGHGFDLFIVVHRTDVHVGLHPLKGRPDGIEAGDWGAVRSLSKPCGLLGWEDVKHGFKANASDTLK